MKLFIEQCILNCNNISVSLYFLYQNAVLVIIGNHFQQHYNNLIPKLLNGRIHIFIHTPTNKQTVGCTEQFRDAFPSLILHVNEAADQSCSEVTF